MILRSAGFVTSDLIGGKNAVNFAYILYLRGRAEKIPAARSRKARAAVVCHVDSARPIHGSPETAFDVDIRQIEARGLKAYADSVIETELPASFWTGMLPQDYGYFVRPEPLLSCLQGRAGEAGRQGVSLP